MSSSSKLRQFSRQYTDQEDTHPFLDRSKYSSDKFGFGNFPKPRLARSSEPPPDPPPAAVAQQFKALSSNANATLSLDRIALESRFSRSIGRRVCVSGEKSGILRYFGPLHVADGLFCGVELDEELGQHDGLVDGRRYFKAAHNRGIFAPLEKVALLLSSPSPPKPNMSTNNRDRLDSSNENLQLHIQNNNLRTLNTHGSPDDAIRPLEYITDVEPHLMSNSMLDEEQDVIELPPYEDLLSQSFEQFLRQSKVFSTESSMIRSSGQFSSDVDHSIEEHEQSGSEINNQMKTYLPVSNMHQPSLSRGDDSADKPCMINSSTTAVPSIDKHYKRTDTFNIEELESLNASPQLLVESFQFDRPSSDKDDQENELLTPIFDNAFNMRLNSDDTFDSNNDNIEPAPKRALVSSTPFTTVAQQSNPKDEISLNTSYVKEKTVPDSNVEENMSTHVNQLRERPASTISADTGYQGDTEYEMSNGSNSARNQQYKTAAKNQQFNTNFGRLVALETSQDVDLSKCSVKLVYSDKKGNVRKVVQLEGHSASVLGLSLEVTTNLTSQISVPSELGQDISNENPPVAQSLRDDKKPNVQRQQQQRSPFKNTLSSNGAKTSSKNVIKLPLSAKNSAAANENGEFKKPRVPLVKESEPKPARVKPATKPSKNAEIMAKLQQSIAQERVKPKKEVKSRVFIASEAIKDEHVGSKNHSRSSSATASVQNSPMDSAVSAINETTKTSPSESAPSETAMKGLRRPPVKNSADAFKFKSTILPNKRDHASVVSEINVKKPLINFPSVVTKRILPASSSRDQTRATLRNSNPVSSSQISAKQIGKVVAKNNANLEKLDADLALARRQISGNAKGFEVLTIVFQHLILNLKTTLRRKSIDLTIANEIAQTLGEEKVSLMMEIASMKEQHENTINAMRNEYKEKLHLFERAMNAEHDKKIFEAQNNHEMEIKTLVEDFIAKEQKLLQLNETNKDEDMKHHLQELSCMKISHEKFIEELKQSFAKDMEDVKLEFDLRKVNYEEKLQETSKLAEKYKDEARKLEESLLSDVDKRMQDVNERIANYKKDNESLKVVVELKNTEIHELRVKCQVLEKELEKYRMLKSKVVVLEQKNIELKEALELKKSAERSSQKRRSASEKAASSHRDSGADDCSPYRPTSARSDALSTTDKRSTLAPNKRRISPFRSPGPRGPEGQALGPSGLPGVETVIEETTSCSTESRSCQHSSENVTISGVVDDSTSVVARPSPSKDRNDDPKMREKRHSNYGGVFYLTDSGVFTSSLHSSQENFTKLSCGENAQSSKNNDSRNSTLD